MLAVKIPALYEKSVETDTRRRLDVLLFFSKIVLS